MGTFVLVHGAWHGAWCWERVAAGLRAAGHEVHTPTLTGVGERAAELRPEVGLDTHVADVAAALDRAGACVLVGHSYAGLVVREAADRAPDRVDRVVLVDGWTGKDGASLLGLAPAWFAEDMRDAAARGDGWFIPPPDPAALGIEDEAVAAAVRPRLTPHPFKTFTDATSLTGAADRIPGRVIVCRPGRGLPFAELAAAHGYGVTDLRSGHDAMLIVPDALTRLLTQEAAP